MLSVFRRLKSGGGVVVSLGVISALLLGLAVPAKTAEEKVVKVELIGAFSGALATTFVPIGQGCLDCIR